MGNLGKKDALFLNNGIQPRGSCGLICSLSICPQAERYCTCSGSAKASTKTDKVFQYNNYQKVTDAM